MEPTGETTIDALEGQSLGPYQIMERIGKGGMAVVYRALQPNLRRYVAIKVLPGYFVHEQGFRDRFLQEAQTAAQLEHPNILPVFDFGQQGDLPYIVMPLVNGGTLREWMAQPVPMERALQVFSRILQALEYAHTRERGIVHRDIKPTNILMSQGEWPLLTDFGIAKIAESSLRLTGPATIVGTPEYMAPEQSRGGPVDQRVDIYGMGIILYELLTGQLPFRGNGPLEIILQHVHDPVPPPSSLKPELAPCWDEVVLRSLAKDPRDRYPSAQIFDRAVQACWRLVQRGGTASQVVGQVDVRGLRDSAARALAEGRWSQVISLCSQILAADPTHLEAGRLLTQAQEGLQRERAARQRQQALDLVRQGEAALAASRYSSAVECFREALRVDPDLTEASGGLQQVERALEGLYQAARADLAAGRWEDAAARVDQLAAAAPEYRDVGALHEQVIAEQQRQAAVGVWYDRGLAALARQDWPAAAVALQQVVDSAPDYRDAAARLVQAQQAQYELDAAAYQSTAGPTTPAAPPEPGAPVYPPAPELVAAGYPAAPAWSPPPAASAARVYVTNRLAGNITVIDAARKAPLATASVGSGPLGIAAAPDGRRVYVANRGSNRLQIVDTASHTVLANLTVGSGPYAVAVHPGGARVYVTNHFGDSVSVVDAAASAVIATVRVGRKPTGIAVHPDGSRAYVAGRDSNSVTVLDAERNVVAGTITLPPRSGPESVAVAPDGSRVYVSAVDQGALLVLDPASRVLVASIPVGPSPYGVAVHPGGTRVYVTTADSIAVVDATTGAVAARVAVDQWPRGLAVTPDGSLLYVANRDSGNVQVVDTATQAVVAAVPAGAGSVGIAIAAG